MLSALICQVKKFMVGFEMLAQVQRDLTAEKVSNLVASQTALILHIGGRYGHEVQ